MNICQNAYMYDLPYTSNYGNPGYSCNCTDFKAENIRVFAEENYKQAYMLDNYFGVSLQCGEIHRTQANQRNPLPHELLYSANLALLYGAKWLSLYGYIAHVATNLCDFNPNGDLCHALVDILPVGGLSYTDKWYMWKNTLKPRLNGLFGKTIKKLTPVETYVGLEDMIMNKRFIKWITVPDYIPAEADHFWIELGFFNDSIDVDNKYFMVINRHTNINGTNFKYRFQYLYDYVNWDVTNYCEEVRSTILSNQDGEAVYEDTISRGDARLYSILPVVKYGGKLIADEDVGEGMTLTDDMTIENGATLYVYGDYNANADITIKPGGKIVSGDNGRIIFANGHQFNIEGTAQINGSANNRLEIVFSGQNAGGIKIKPNGTLKAFYCNIVGVNGAKSGILSELQTRSVIMENVNINGFKECGMMLTGSFRENIPDITPTIKNCVIKNCGLGISAANFAEFVILGNTITDCELGIFISQIPAAHIIGNNIIFTSTPVLLGIFMTSSNGNVRGNTIRSHTIGIFLANSSPNIGGNTLESNSEHGLYVGSGSKPNLRRGLAGPLPLVIATSGYNIIKENGYEGFGPMNGDGSEIYLKESSIILDYGCNQIIDDRQIPESMLLMNGTHLGTLRVIDARYNYWGTITPTNARFGNLSVIYEPFNQYPYNSGPCLTPQSACYVISAKTSKGELIDEIDAKNCENGQLTALEESYAEAEKYYLNGEMNSAKEIYEQIAEGQAAAEEKLYAYEKLYAIGNLIDTTANYFTDL